MRKAFLPLVAFVAVVANGCGGGDKVTGNTGLSSGCTATLTGAVTGTFTCVPGAGVVTTWSPGTNLTALGAVITGATQITMSVGFPGQPSAGTYLSTNATTVGGISVTTGTSAVWVASGGPGAPGSFTLILTSVSVGVSNAGGTLYTVHGTFDATLPPASGPGASVTVHMTF